MLHASADAIMQRQEHRSPFKKKKNPGFIEKKGFNHLEEVLLPYQKM
jgi:hypothetical protein